VYGPADGPLHLAISCFRKIQIGFTFLVLAHLGSPASVCVCVCYMNCEVVAVYMCVYCCYLLIHKEYFGPR